MRLLCSFFAFLLAAGLLTACSPETAPTQPHQDGAHPEQSPLIDRAVLFGNANRSQGRISPDGRYLSWLAPHNGVMNIWVAPSDAPEQARVVTSDTGRGIPIHRWAYTNDHILYTQDKGGNENTQVYAVSVEDGSVRNLTPADDDVRANIVAVAPSRPETVLVAINDRSPQLFDLWNVNIRTGKAERVRENPGYANWLADNDLQPRLAYKPLPGGAMQVMRLGAEEDTPLRVVAPEDVMTTFPFGFDKTNENVYLVDSSGRDTAALVQTNLETGETTVLAADPRADVSSVWIDPVSRDVVGWASNYLKVEWRGMGEHAQEVRRIAEAIPGSLTFLSATGDGRKLVIYADDPQQPGAYYLYDRDAESARKLFDTRPELAEASLVPTLPLEVQSRDGLTLVSYLTLPPAADKNGDGKPEEKLPMVLVVHGGPWARDEYGYMSLHQWLANRGYAVLSVNYRGSTGFGKNFVNAAVNEFAGKMHDDLIDAVTTLVDQGVADPDRVAIMGGSYGGYATLVGLTFTPDTFACGVDIVGPSSLITLVESFPAYWGPQLEASWYKFVGNPADESDRAVMRNKSPISRVADIKVPLLIGQGENDPRVTKAESDQIVEAMQARNLPVTYLNYPDEGHGFVRPENRLSFFATTEAFLADCLGGRYQQIGDDFENSSVQVLHGAEYVPGLVEASQ